MSSYDTGDLVTLRATFINAAGTPTNPTTVVLRVTPPTGATILPTVVSDGSGAYHADVTPTQPGNWAWRWVGTGAVAEAEQGRFYVRPDLTS